MRHPAGRARASNLNRIAAALIGAAAAAAFAATYWFDPVPPGLPGLGAVEFPRLVCAVILGLCALLWLQESPPPDPDNAPPDAQGWAIWGCCALFLPAMALVGMFGAGFVFLVAAGCLWGERRLPLLAGTAAGLTAALWLVFVEIFRLTLPGGLLFGD